MQFQLLISRLQIICTYVVVNATQTRSGMAIARKLRLRNAPPPHYQFIPHADVPSSPLYAATLTLKYFL